MPAHPVPVAAQLEHLADFEMRWLEPGTFAHGAVVFETVVEFALRAEQVATEHARLVGIGRLGMLAQEGLEFLERTLAVAKGVAAVGAAEDRRLAVAGVLAISMQVCGQVVAAGGVFALETECQAEPVAGLLGDGCLAVAGKQLAE